MKSTIVGLALLLMLGASTPLFAQSSQGYYQEVGRSNDPFVFCTEGVPEDFWIATDPLHGLYQVIDEYYYNPRWIEAYQTICPKAMATGSWEGKDGVPDLVPYFH
jgi:hypothetical protein